VQRAVFLAQVARDLLLGAEAAEHAERQEVMMMSSNRLEMSATPRCAEPE